jgi:hypothetical protein
LYFHAESPRHELEMRAELAGDLAERLVVVEVEGSLVNGVGCGDLTPRSVSGGQAEDGPESAG